MEKIVRLSTLMVGVAALGRTRSAPVLVRAAAVLVQNELDVRKERRRKERRKRKARKRKKYGNFSQLENFQGEK
jgi:hypothetical protein